MPGGLSRGAISDNIIGAVLVEKPMVRRFDNLLLWLDASQLSGAEGDTLAEWLNLESDSNLDFLSTGANGPTLALSTQNGLNTVAFDGTTADHQISRGLWTETMPWTIYVVAKRTGNLNVFNRVFYTTAGEVGFNNSADTFYSYAGAGTYPQIAAADNAYHVFHAELNGTASLLEANDSASAQTDVGTLNPDSELYLSHNVSAPLTGNIAEIVLYSDSQDSDEVNVITHHLLSKWGLST